MKKLLLIAVVALCLTAVVGIGASGGGGNTAGAADPKAAYVYRLYPPTHVSDSSNLDGLLSQGYRDILVPINMSPGAGDLAVVLEDCCILGDTVLGIMIRSWGPPIWDWGTSGTANPTVQLLTPMPGYSWALVIAGYIRAPGGFPAGYYIDIDLRGPG